MSAAQSQYAETHKASIEAVLSDAVSAVFEACPPNPLAFLAAYLAQASAGSEGAASALPVDVGAFFTRSDPQNVSAVFEECAGSGRGLARDRLPAALTKLGMTFDHEAELDSLLQVLDVAEGESGLGLEDFQRVLHHPSPMEEWASTLPLPQLLAACVPRPAASEVPLRHIASLDDGALARVQASFAAGVQKLLHDAIMRLRDSLAGMDRMASDKTGAAAKFATFKSAPRSPRSRPL
jgi:hypothetical protein